MKRGKPGRTNARNASLPLHGRESRSGNSRASRRRRQVISSALLLCLMLVCSVAMLWRHSQSPRPVKKTISTKEKAEIVAVGLKQLETEAPSEDVTMQKEIEQGVVEKETLSNKVSAPVLVRRETSYKDELMPPSPKGVPRLDPYRIQKELWNTDTLTDSECESHRRAIPMHAKALDLVKVQSAPKDGPLLLCIIYTYEKKHPAARIAAQTWLNRCDGALVLSNANDTHAYAVAVPHTGPEAWGNIWQKTRANWRYIYENYFNQFDYFVFGGDDMYILASNLKRYLASAEIAQLTNSGRPLYLGRRFKANGNVEKIFNSGGAGYVFNRQALQLLYDVFDQPFCQPNLKGFWEDVMVAQCLKKATIPTDAYDTRDPQGRERFHPFTPGQHLTYHAPKDGNDWYLKYSIDLKFGPDCCSPESVAYHYVKPDLMIHMDALLFRCPRHNGNN